jgi:hypothetical protein
MAREAREAEAARDRRAREAAAERAEREAAERAAAERTEREREGREAAERERARAARRPSEQAAPVAGASRAPAPRKRAAARPSPRPFEVLLAEARQVTAGWPTERITAEELRTTLRCGAAPARQVRDALTADRAATSPAAAPAVPDTDGSTAAEEPDDAAVAA